MSNISVLFAPLGGEENLNFSQCSTLFIMFIPCLYSRTFASPAVGHSKQPLGGIKSSFFNVQHAVHLLIMFIPCLYSRTFSLSFIHCPLSQFLSKYLE